VTYKAKPKRERINPIMFFQKGKKKKEKAIFISTKHVEDW
jgi:hypothetical protein